MSEDKVVKLGKRTHKEHKQENPDKSGDIDAMGIDDTHFIHGGLTFSPENASFPANILSSFLQ